MRRCEMARRRGSGSVRRRSDGRWEGQLRLADGSRKYVYARNRRELITRLQEERWRLASGMPVRARGLTLANYAEQWLEVMRCRLRPTTFAGYELCLGRAVRQLGSVPIARLTPQMIQACYAGLLAEGLSPRTVFHTHAVLHRALRQARNWGLTSGIPTELVSVPRLPYREMQALSKAQLEVLFETSGETRWYPLWVLLGTTGLRIGEALGLRWSDVDLIARRLQVRRALQRQRGRGLVFVEPKSVTSRRGVELPQLAIAVLRLHRLRVDGELVFPNRHASQWRQAPSATHRSSLWTEPGYRGSGFTICGTRRRPSCSRLGASEAGPAPPGQQHRGPDAEHLQPRHTWAERRGGPDDESTLWRRYLPPCSRGADASSADGLGGSCHQADGYQVARPVRSQRLLAPPSMAKARLARAEALGLAAIRRRRRRRPWGGTDSRS